ncbi:MAG: hypothetical protein WA777_16455 [Rhodanobacter sp.]
MPRITCLLVVLSALLIGGCATSKKSDMLTTTLAAYANVIRWGDIQGATKYIDPKVLAKNPPSQLDLERFSQVKVSEYDEGTGPVPMGNNQVSQAVQIGLINRNTQGERTIVDHQVWRYDEDSKHWWLESGLPDITRD